MNPRWVATTSPQLDVARLRCVFSVGQFKLHDKPERSLKLCCPGATVTDEVREPPRSLGTVVHRECEVHVCMRSFRVLYLAVIEKDRSDQWVSYRPGDDDVPPLISKLHATTIAASCWFEMSMFERVMTGGKAAWKIASGSSSRPTSTHHSGRGSSPEWMEAQVLGAEEQRE